MQNTGRAVAVFRDLVEKAKADATLLLGSFSDAMYQQFRDRIDAEHATRDRYAELAKAF